jgi:hypothetical protein
LRRVGGRQKQFGNFGDKANDMPLLGIETRLVGFAVRIIFYVDVVYDRKIRTYHSGPIEIRKNILSFVCATSDGKQGLKGRFGSYFASILVVCGNC